MTVFDFWGKINLNNRVRRIFTSTRCLVISDIYHHQCKSDYQSLMEADEEVHGPTYSYPSQEKFKNGTQIVNKDKIFIIVDPC